MHSFDKSKYLVWLVLLTLTSIRCCFCLFFLWSVWLFDKLTALHLQFPYLMWSIIGFWPTHYGIRLAKQPTHFFFSIFICNLIKIHNESERNTRNCSLNMGFCFKLCISFPFFVFNALCNADFVLFFFFFSFFSCWRLYL